MMMRPTLAAATCVALFLIGGCASYYKVTDPTTGEVYYSQELKRQDNGATTLKDAKTGNMVNIQNSEIDEVSKEEFDTGRFATQLPAEPPAATPAPAAAPTGAAPAPTPPAKPVALSQIKSELIESKAQVQATTDSLNKLQKSPAADATANYNAYSEQYLKLKSKAESVKARAADLKTRASAYLANWNQQANVENPALRRQAIQQQADAEKLFNTITSEMELTRIEF